MSRYRLNAAAVLLVAAGVLLPPAVRANNPTPPDPSVTPPTVLHRVDPQYPKDARQAGVQGQVLIFATIDIHGRTEKLRPAKIVKKWPSFTDAAMKVLPEWRFKPATKGGKPVPYEVVIPFDFKLDSTPLRPLSPQR